MKKVSSYSSIPEIGDRYEFCKIMDDGLSHTFYGEIVGLDHTNHSFAFAKLDNGISNKRTDEAIMLNITAVRGIVVDPSTWTINIKPKKKEKVFTTVVFTEDELKDHRIDVEEFAESLSDAISRKTGFLHKGFSFNVVVEAELDESE